MGSGVSVSASSEAQVAAEVAFKDGNYLEAIQCWTQAISAEREDPKISIRQLAVLLSSRSKCYYQAEMFESALVDGALAVELDPTWYRGYHTSGKALAALGRGLEAISALSKAIALCCNDEPLQEERAALENGLSLQLRSFQGSTYTWGVAQTGALGRTSSRDCENPVMVDALRGKHVVDASCGAMHCVAVSGCGEVFSWGNNKYGQLGHDESKDHISLPGIVPGLMGIFINAVSCGGGHTIVTTKDGLVYSWGMGTNGQLGLGTTETVFRPQRITALGSLAVTAVATGLAHSLFLSSDGSVFSCGMNTCGALGQNTGGDSVLFPSPIHIESRDSGTVKYVHISAGGAHTILVSEAGDLYAAGSNSCGQLGLGHEVGDCHIFCRLRDEITQNFRFSFVRCGEEFSVAISRNHSVFSCGFGIGGQLGSGCRENRNTFCLIPELESCLIETVSCSQGAVFALSRSGAVYTWGTMLHYSEFGLSVSEVAPPARPSISKIFCKRKKARHICCGRKHYLMLGVAPFGPVSYIVTNSWKGCDPTNDCARVRAGTSIRCIVQTVDNLGSHVDFGGSCIQCRATRLSASVRSKYMNPNMQVDDNLDGTYSLTIVLFSTGIYEIAFLLDELHLQESPYFVEVLPNDLGLYSCEIVEVSVSATRPKEEIVCFPFEPNSGRFSTVHIESDMISAQINDTLSVSFKLSDKYGNIIDEFGDDPQLVVKCSDHRGGDNLCREAVHCLSHAQNLRRTTLLNSHVFCLYYQLPAKAGVYDIKVMLNSSQILNWSLEIASKEVSGNMSVVLAPAEGNVDEPIIVTVLPRNNSGVKVLIDLASMIHNDEVIRSSICQLECEISARAIVHFGHLRKKCVDVAGELTLDEISGNILLSHTLRYAGLAQLIVWIGSTTVFQKKIMVNAGKPSETFSELLNPRISLAPWSPNVESCRKVLFQCRDSYGNKVVKENHQVFADLLIIQGNKCIQKQALIVSEMSSGLFLINVECDFSYASNYGFELAVNLNGKNVLYSPFLMRAESGAEHRDIAHSSVKALGELATIYSDIVLPPDSTVPLNKKKLAEITNSRAIDCLKETQRRLHEERAARKKLHTVKRTGGGFIIQYSKDI